MTEPNSSDFHIEPKLFDLFKVEVENQNSILNQGLLAIEKGEAPQSEALMRAAHSIKGAARIVGVNQIVQLAHQLEDFFVFVQNKKLSFTPDAIDILFKATDLFSSIPKLAFSEFSKWLIEKQKGIELTIQLIKDLNSNVKGPLESPDPLIRAMPPIVQEKILDPLSKRERFLRVSAESLNSLMGLAGEILVESRLLKPIEKSLENTKKVNRLLGENLDSFREETLKANDKKNEILVTDMIHLQQDLQYQLNQTLSVLNSYIYQHESLTNNLYQQALTARMRPFSDILEGFPRYIRDLSKALKKEVDLEIIGKSTLVDRDILEKLETPLLHLISNSIDHGIESPEERKAQGKSAKGKIQLEAKHGSGHLYITISDDGRGLDFNKLRRIAVDKKLISPQKAQKLSEKDVVELISLPGFSAATHVTEFSGRGVGLKVALNVAKEVGGNIKITSIKNKGVTIVLQLPLTISVIRSLLVEIANEPYAFPLVRLYHMLEISKDEIKMIDGQAALYFEDQSIPLFDMAEVLEIGKIEHKEKMSVIILKGENHYYGCIVDKYLEEKDLVVQPIDPILGKIKDISSGAFLEDGSPVLILDIGGLINSIENRQMGVKR